MAPNSIVAVAIASATAIGAFAFTRMLQKGHKYPVYILKNDAGMEVHICAVGAAIMKMLVPDKHGNQADVVLGYEKPSDYMTVDPPTYFGVVVGRVANRIANGKFTLDGTEYNLLVNNGPNALHGGAKGLHKQLFSATKTTTPDAEVLELQYTSPDGEEGYPGTVIVRVTYSLSKVRNELSTTIQANTDRSTPVNIAQHSYFNLGGHSSGTILNHSLKLAADHYTPVNEHQIPTGQIVHVAGTPFDFRESHTIGERIEAVPGGYDHNYVLFNMGPQAKYIIKEGSGGMASTKPKLAATVSEPVSGRVMDILTSAPGVQFYSGNFLDGSVPGKEGAVYNKHAGFCLETQNFPNAINEPNFPSPILKKHHTYKHHIVYRFHNLNIVFNAA